MSASSLKTDSRFRALCEVSRAISAALSVEEVLALICERTGGLLSAESVVITRLREPPGDHEERFLEVVATSPGARSLGAGRRVSLEQSLNGHALTKRRTLFSNDLASDARVDQAAAAAIGASQAIVAPLYYGDTPLGVISVLNSSISRPFDDDDAELLTALADHAAVAIRNAEAFEAGHEQLKTLSSLQRSQDRYTKQLQGLVRVGLTLSREHSLELVLQTLVESARETIGARYVALGVLNSGGNELERFVTSGVDEATRKRIGRTPRGGGTLGIMLREASNVRISDLSKHPDFAGFPDGHPTMTTLLGVPIRIRGRVFGNFYMADKLDGSEFSDEDEKLAELLAAEAAVAIDNAMLYEQQTKFYAIVNHEIKNAAAGVLGWTDRLSTLTRDGERRVREGADYAHQGARNLYRLVVDLLDLSRLEARLLDLDSREVDVRALVREVIAAMRPAADERDIKLVVSGLDNRAIVRTDRARARQILLNLLSNAIKFSPRGERVDLDLAPAPDGGWSLSVRDRGPGVRPEDRERIFQIQVRDRKSDGGAGLGLAISRQLATALGGALELVDVDQGASFRLELPPAAPTVYSESSAGVKQ